MSLIGRSLGPYEITGDLGAGAMGQVYRARDTRLDRDVALKTLPPALADDPDRVERFEREARALAALDHPNIVAIHSVESIDGHRFLTMQLVDGRPLSDHIPPGGLPQERFFDWAIALCSAVAGAHRHGIVHRDLKPANVMIDSDERLRVLDFGLAKLRDDAPPVSPDSSLTPTITVDPRITTEGALVGTIAYMAPEQAEGRDVTQRADVFSLGVMLHEMAAGAVPFQGDSALSVLAAVVKETPPPVHEVAPRWPRQLGRIVTAALQKDPEQRTQSAQDLRNQLEALRDELRESPPEPVVQSRPSSRNSLAALVVTTAVAFGLGRILAPTADGPEIETPVITVERLTTSGVVVHAAISPDGRSLAYVENRDGLTNLRVRQLATGSDLSIVEPVDQFMGPPMFGDDGEYLYYVAAPRLGSWETAPGVLYRIPVLGGQPRRIIGGVAGLAVMAPDGQSIAMVMVDSTGRETPIIHHLDGSAADSLTGAGEHLLPALAWSPDGGRIAAPVYDSDDKWTLIQVHDVVSGTRQFLADGWGDVHGLAWLPDESSLLISGAHERSGWFYHLWIQTDLDGAARRLTTDTSNYLGVSVTADGRSLVSVQSEWHADLWEAPAGHPNRVRRITDGLVHGNFGLAAMPDGRIVEVRRDFRMAIVDPADGSDVLVGDENTCRSPDVSPDGSLLVYSSWREGSDGVWLQRSDGSDLRRITDLQTGRSYPRFTPDGRWIVYRNRAANHETINKVPIDGGESVEVVAHPAGPPAVSPEGARVAFVTDWRDDGTRAVRVASMVDGHLVVELALGTELLERRIDDDSIRWTPDGSALTFAAEGDGVRNLWRLPVDGGDAEQLTTFADQSVIFHDWTTDGRLVMSRGDAREDAVLVRGFR